VNHIAFYKDQTILASYSDQKEAEILDFKTRKLEITLEGHNDYGFCLDWHPNGTYLVTGNQDTTARVWDLRNPKQSVHVLQGEIGAIYTVKYSHDGSYLALGEAIEFVSIFNPEDSKKLFIGVNIKDFDGIFEFQQRNKEKSIFQLKTRSHDDSYLILMG